MFKESMMRLVLNILLLIAEILDTLEWLDFDWFVLLQVVQEIGFRGA